MNFNLYLVHVRNVNKCLPCDTRAGILLVLSLYLGAHLCVCRPLLGFEAYVTLTSHVQFESNLA